MKKTYINPNIEVVMIQTIELLTVSGGDRITETGINPQSGDAITPGMARGFDLDFDED